MLSKYQKKHFFQLQSVLSFLIYLVTVYPFLLLALKQRMVRHCAAVLQTRRPLRAQVWFYIPTWRAMASAGSPSCTALTATTNYHRSPCLETLPLLENCELKWSQRETAVVSNSLQLCVCLWNCQSLLNSFHFPFQAWRGLDCDSICSGKRWLQVNKSAPKNIKVILMMFC